MLKDRGLFKTAIALAVGLLLYVLTSTSGLPPEQVGVAAVFGFAITLWVTEAIPLTVTAFLAVALLVIVGGVSQKTVFGAFGSSVILLFIGSFTLAKAFEVNGVHERIARWILTRPFAVRTPATLLLTVGSICLLFSLFISNTAATAMMLPIVLMVLKAVGQDKPGSKLSVPMMLMMTWGASFAVGTPVSTPPNAIGIGMIAEATGTTISFGQWMLFAMPIALTMLFFGWLLLKRLYLKGVTIELPERLQFDRPLEPWSQPQKVVVGIFGVVLACWLLPDILNLILGSSNPLTSWMDIRLTSGASALLGLGLCFIVPVKGTPSGRVLTKEQAMGIDWGTVMLIGGGLALGAAAFESGLAATMGKGIASAAQSIDATMAAQFGVTGVAIIMMTVLSVLLAVGASELASNTASVNAILPIVIGMAQGAEINPIGPALAVTIAGSLGFMLPVSTPPNAIAYSSGLLTAKQMIRAGIWVDLIGIIVVLVLISLLLPLVGLI